jgi:hypothetical protein
MALHHWQYPCPTCQRPTLHVRNSYDVPHLEHLVFFALLVLTSLLTDDSTISIVLILAAAGWLCVWAVTWLANKLIRKEPFRCHACGLAAGESQKPI